MSLLAEQNNAVFLGQAVEYPGTALFNTLKDIPENKRWELPVAENMQLGMSIGLSLQQYLPISIFPRINFLLSATDQLVNHLDKLTDMSQNQYKPKIIIRTAIGSIHPLDPGSQHKYDYSYALSNMLDDVDVIRLDKKEIIVPSYKKALASLNSTILVELADNYNT